MTEIIRIWGHLWEQLQVDNPWGILLELLFVEYQWNKMGTAYGRDRLDQWRCEYMWYIMANEEVNQQIQGYHRK